METFVCLGVGVLAGLLAIRLYALLGAIRDYYVAMTESERLLFDDEAEDDPWTDIVRNPEDHKEWHTLSSSDGRVELPTKHEAKGLEELIETRDRWRAQRSSQEQIELPQGHSSNYPPPKPADGPTQ